MLICDGGRPGIATKKRLSFGMFRIEFLPTRSYSSTSIAAATDQLRSCSASPRDGRQLSGQILSVLYAGVQAVAYLFTAGSVVPTSSTEQCRKFAQVSARQSWWWP